MRILDIYKDSIVDGPGIRDVIFTAGCLHRCEGCHNPESWDMRGGYEMEAVQIAASPSSSDRNVTISGGDPFYQENELTRLCQSLKEQGKGIWVYTGFLWEEVKHWRSVFYIDVLVDGPYQKELYSPNLIFRGSSNQTIIDVPSSLRTGWKIKWEDDLLSQEATVHYRLK